MKKILAAGIFGSALLACAPAAPAIDGLSAELGAAEHGVRLWRLGAQWDQRVQQFEHTHWHIHWDFTLGGWKSDAGTMHDVAITPVLRWAPGDRGAYAEGGVGLHLLSDSHVSSDLDFSTRLQFGSHLGAGYRFSRYDVALRVQHLSNGGARNPNPGINFVEMRLIRWLGD